MATNIIVYTKEKIDEKLGDGSWEAPFQLGAYRLWVDSTGDLRMSNGDPSSDTDGTVVGTQT